MDGFYRGGTPQLNGFDKTSWLWAVTWTLRLEFVFYLLIPFLGWFSKTIWRSLLFVAGCNLFYGATVLMESMQWHAPGFYLVQALLRFLSFSFCVGILAAHIVKLPAAQRWSRSIWGAPVSAAFLVYTFAWGTPVHGPIESILLCVPFIVIACGNDFWGFLRSRALLFLGQISYSVYLLHCLIMGAILLPIYSRRPQMLTDPLSYWIVLALVGLLVVLVSTLWHRVLEFPFFLAPQAVLSGCRPVSW